MNENTKYSENDLVRECIPLLRGVIAPNTSDAELYEQIPIGSSIPDVLLFHRLANSPKHVPPPLSAKEATLLASLRTNGTRVRVDNLENQLGQERRSIRGARLHELENRNLIQRSAGGYLRNRTRWASETRIHAIEAKLSRWQDALVQAKRYLLFADYSYVLLPEGVANKPTFAIDRFADSNVGLLLYSSNNLVVACRPRRNSIYTWRREFVVSRLLNHGPDRRSE